MKLLVVFGMSVAMVIIMAGRACATMMDEQGNGLGFPFPGRDVIVNATTGGQLERVKSAHEWLDRAGGILATNDTGVQDVQVIRLLKDAEDVFRNGMSMPVSSMADTLGLAAVYDLRGETDRAMTVVADGLLKYPASSHLMNYRAWLFYKSGKLEESASAYTRALQGRPSLPASYQGLAGVLVMMLRHDAAADVCVKALSLWPEHEGIASTLVEALSLAGRTSESDKECHLFLDKHPESVWMRFRRAQMFLRDGSTERGISELKEVVRLAPKSVAAYNELGVVSRQRKEYQEALGYFRAGLRLQAHDTSLLENMGVCYSEMKEYDKSVEVLRRAQRANAASDGVDVTLASAYMAQGDFPSALSVCTNAVREKPWSHGAYLKTCECLLKIGKNEEALSYARKGMSVGKPGDSSWSLYGHALKACGMYDEAGECFTKAALLNTNDIRHVIARASALLEGGHVDESIAFCQSAADRFPKGLSPIHLMGVGLKMQGKTQEAISCFKRVTEAEQVPEAEQDVVGFAWGDLGSVYCMLERWAEAKEAYKRALRFNPSNMEWEAECIRAEGYLDPESAKRKLAEALMRAPGHPQLLALRACLACQSPVQERAAVLREVEAKAATDPWARFWCGCLAKSLGDSGKAVTNWLEAVRLSPKWMPPYRELGVAASQRKAPLPEVLAWFNKAIELEPNNAQCRNDLGYTYLLYGQLPDAVREFEKAITLKPSFGLAYYNLGQAKNACGQYKEALNALRQASALGYLGDPDFMKRVDALARAGGAKD